MTGKTGPGILALSGYNRYIGGTTVNASTVLMTAGGTAGTVRRTLNVNSGVTVRLTAVNALGSGTAPA